MISMHRLQTTSRQAFPRADTHGCTETQHHIDVLIMPSRCMWGLLQAPLARCRVNGV